MRYGDIIGCGFKSNDRRILHTDTEQSGEDSFGAGSHIEIFFE